MDCVQKQLANTNTWAKHNNYMDDYRFFKFRLINKNLIDSLVNGSLYFALPSKLNDPFDCQIDLKKSARFAASKVSGLKREILLKIANLDTFVDGIQQKMRKVGVCSFSLSLEESLLWSHYADEHRGVCLLYEFTESFFLEKMNKIVGVTDIVYGENPLSDWLIESIPEQITDEFFDHFTTELLKKVLIVKAEGWHYENECRIIREQSGPFLLPKGYLKQVCFGMNTPESDIQLVRKIVDSSGYNVNYCRICRMETDFGIKAVDI